MCMSLLSACRRAPCVCLVPMEARKGCQMPLELELWVVVVSYHWGLEIQPGPQERQPVVVTDEPSLQPLGGIFILSPSHLLPSLRKRGCSAEITRDKGRKGERIPRASPWSQAQAPSQHLLLAV